MRRPWRRATITGALAVIGSLLFVAPPAGATTATYVDPRPCSANVNGGACISQIDIAYTMGEVTLRMTVGLATDPTTNSEWTTLPGPAYLRWQLVPSNEPEIDGFAVGAISQGPGTFSGFTERVANGTAVCSTISDIVRPSFDLAANSYTITLPASCIGNMTSFDVFAIYSVGGTVAISPQSGFCCTVNETTTPPGSTVPPVTNPSVSQGYDLAASDGGLFTFGDAPFYGSVGGSASAPIVGIAPDPRTSGYRMATTTGGLWWFGSSSYGWVTGRLNAPVVGIAADDATGGYWMVASDGGVFAFNAPFLGSMGGTRLNQPIVGMAGTSDGNGYWLVARDGGVFAFGDAAFYGSMGGVRLNQPVVGMATDTQTGGYWLVAKDGGVFAFNAPFDGSTGGTRLDAPIVGMAATQDGNGYWFVGADGGVFSFGDAQFEGSMGGVPLDAPVVGIMGTG